jgi:hypothetical protein
MKRQVTNHLFEEVEVSGLSRQNQREALLE